MEQWQHQQRIRVKKACLDCGNIIKKINICIVGSPKGEKNEKLAESLFWRSNGWKCPTIWGGDLTSKFIKPKGSQIEPKEVYQDISQLNYQMSKTKNFESKQGHPIRLLVNFLNRNIAGMEKVRWYIQNTERK